MRKSIVAKAMEKKEGSDQFNSMAAAFTKYKGGGAKQKKIRSGMANMLPEAEDKTDEDLNKNVGAKAYYEFMQKKRAKK